MAINSTNSFLYGLSGTTTIPTTASSKRPKHLPSTVASLILPGKAPRKTQGPTDHDIGGARQVIDAMSREMQPQEFDQLTAQCPSYSLSDGGHKKWTAMSIAINGNYSMPFIAHILGRDPSLVNRGMGVNHLTPLMLSCFTPKRLELLKFFISKNGDINIGSKEGDTALVYAGSRNNSAAMKYLILRGAVIYQNSLDEEDPDSRLLSYLADAVEELWGMQCFMRATLHSAEGRSFVSKLPEEVRIHIAGFLEI